MHPRAEQSKHNAAAVLFGKDFTDYPQCRLRLARFKGTTKRDFIKNQQEEGNIFQLVDAADAMMQNEEIAD